MEKKEIVFLTLPAAGHLTSMVEMAMILLHHDNRFYATVLLVPMPILGLPSMADSCIKSVASSGLHIGFEELPPVEPPVIDEDEGIVTIMSLFIQAYKPHVMAAIYNRLSSSTQIAALVLDIFATTMIDVANELGVPAYIYFTTGAAMLALMLHVPALHEMLPLEMEEVEGEIEVPGMSPTPPLSMSSSLLDKKKQSYSWFMYHGRRFREAKGIIVNTFDELEPLPLKTLAGDGRIPPIYPVGPVLGLHDHSKSKEEQHDCLKWLDEQPPASVVFLCFGSMGSFTTPQVNEIAAALERCGCRFLWSLRTRTVEQGNPVDPNLKELLPNKFLKRTNGRGLVWPSSVPQVQILSHRAIGGFVTHCGWNSCLESIWFGVPLLAWPLYAEQHFNAVRLVRDMGVAVELRVDRKNDNFVCAEELERGLKCLMEDSEGKKVKKRVQLMKVASRKGVAVGGTSFVSFKRLAEELANGENH